MNKEQYETLKAWARWAAVNPVTSDQFEHALATQALIESYEKLEAALVVAENKFIEIINFCKFSIDPIHQISKKALEEISKVKGEV
jgi:ribosomal protein L15